MSHRLRAWEHSRFTALGGCKFTAEWSGNFRLFWLKRDRRIEQNARSRTSVEPSARFPVWTDAGKARDALRLTTRIYNYRVQQSVSEAVFQAVSGCAAHSSRQNLLTLHRNYHMLRKCGHCSEKITIGYMGVRIREQESSLESFFCCQVSGSIKLHEKLEA